MLLIAGCKKHYYTPDSKQIIMFQYDYISSSEHKGFMIDNEGNVYTYSNPLTWNMPDNDLEISQEQVSENTGNSVYSGIKIPEDEFSKYTKVIDYIALSKVTAPGKSESSDAIIRYICYQYDKDSQRYKGHLIRSDGQVTRENMNFHSKRVVQWLNDIESSLPSD